jgi:hypothetical protein
MDQMISKGFTCINIEGNTSCFQKDILCVDVLEIDEKYLGLMGYWVCDGRKLPIITLNKVKKTRLSQVIDRLLTAKPSTNNLYHCEIYCVHCTETIEQKITSERFSMIKGFVDVHHTEYGRCVVMIDRPSAQVVMNLLQQLKFCLHCSLVLSYNNESLKTNPEVSDPVPSVS